MDKRVKITITVKISAPDDWDGVAEQEITLDAEKLAEFKAPLLGMDALVWIAKCRYQQNNGPEKQPDYSGNYQ